jgi:hypothetical protein
MSLKKFLAIPALIILYIYAVNYFVYSGIPLISFAPPKTESESTGSGSVVTVGIGQGASVEVRRPYFFGLITLPVFTGSLGDISIYHDIFFAFIGFLTVLFVLIELRNRRWKR